MALNRSFHGIGSQGKYVGDFTAVARRERLRLIGPVGGFMISNTSILLSALFPIVGSCAAPSFGWLNIFRLPNRENLSRLSGHIVCCLFTNATFFAQSLQFSETGKVVSAIYGLN